MQRILSFAVAMNYLKLINFVIQISIGIRHKVVFFLTLGEIRSSDDVRSVLADFTPLSLWGASLHPAGKRGWSDVGGLRTVKEALVESLLWPGKVTRSCWRGGTEWRLAPDKNKLVRLEQKIPDRRSILKI